MPNYRAKGEIMDIMTIINYSKIPNLPFFIIGLLSPNSDIVVFSSNSIDEKTLSSYLHQGSIEMLVARETKVLNNSIFDNIDLILYSAEQEDNFRSFCASQTSGNMISVLYYGELVEIPSYEKSNCITIVLWNHYFKKRTVFQINNSPYARECLFRFADYETSEIPNLSKNNL